MLTFLMVLAKVIGRFQGMPNERLNTLSFLDIDVSNLIGPGECRYDRHSCEDGTGIYTSRSNVANVQGPEGSGSWDQLGNAAVMRSPGTHSALLI